MKLTAPLLLLFVASAPLLKAAAPVPPHVLVPGWEMGLFAAEPEIMTPIGIAVDGKSRVFVVESHTHKVAPGYPGPKTDRVKILEDTDGDGRADRIRIFAEGFTAAMNLAFDPDGVLHLVHRNGVLRLEDRDGDGVCEKQVPLLTLDTKETYPHNGLSSIAFTDDGFMFIGSGENFGTPYTAVAADGSRVSWLPGGANVFRLKRDGSQVEIYATGMWNAFVLTTDGAGRLFVADNDPDSRPPCRLLHPAPGADFGYQFQYGRSGLHPFTCWNGELPGTLPMTAGTGEAPTGILDARLARLGAERGSGFLLTEWGGSTLSWFRLQPQGASFTASREVVIRGETGFRPSCLAAAPDGSVFLTDWADREYAVHQKGRIWRIKATEPDKTPRDRQPLPLSEAEQHCRHLASLTDAAAWPELRAALTSADPYVTTAALRALRQPVFLEPLRAAVRDADPKIRLYSLLALRRAAVPEALALAEAALRDADAAVRRLGMIHAAGLREKALRPLLEKALEAGGADHPISQDDFALWLAAMDLISREVPPTAATAAASNDDLLQKLLADPATSSGIKAAVIPMLTNFKAPAMIRTLMSLASGGDAKVRQEAVRSLALVTVKAVAAPLQKIALDPAEPASLRMDAISALAKRDTPEVLPLLPLLTDRDPDIATETARALRLHGPEPSVKTALETALKTGAAAVPEQAALALGVPLDAKRPADDAGWLTALMDRGAPASRERGRHIFFSAGAQCSQCHIAEGRGALVGPNLGNIARSSDRAKLIQSIMEPSREIGPLYGTKVVTLKDGSVISGVQALKDGGGTLSLLQAGGTALPAPRDQIVKVDESPVSLMPEGMELALTLQDFRDLLSYLESLR